MINLFYVFDYVYFNCQVSLDNRWRLVEIDASLSHLKQETEHVLTLIHPTNTYMVCAVLSCSYHKKLSVHYSTCPCWKQNFFSCLQFILLA